MHLDSEADPCLYDDAEPACRCAELPISIEPLSLLGKVDPIRSVIIPDYPKGGVWKFPESDKSTELAAS